MYKHLKRYTEPLVQKLKCVQFILIDILIQKASSWDNLAVEELKKTKKVLLSVALKPLLLQWISLIGISRNVWFH